jgi:mono/diheme cytochrome c family protein
MRTHKPFRILLIGVALFAFGVASAAPAENQAPPRTDGSGLLERGKYMVVTGHCNNCHTEGYAAKSGEVPEAKWLQGNSVGWRSKAGTVYAPNLRLYVQSMPWRRGWSPQETRGHVHPCRGGASARRPMKIWSRCTRTSPR